MHGAPQSREDQQRPRGAALGGGVQGGEVEGVVQDAGVDLPGRAGARRCAARRSWRPRPAGPRSARAPRAPCPRRRRTARRARRARPRGPGRAPAGTATPPSAGAPRPEAALPSEGGNSTSTAILLLVRTGEGVRPLAPAYGRCARLDPARPSQPGQPPGTARGSAPNPAPQTPEGLDFCRPAPEAFRSNAARTTTGVSAARGALGGAPSNAVEGVRRAGKRAQHPAQPYARWHAPPPPPRDRRRRGPAARRPHRTAFDARRPRRLPGRRARRGGAGRRRAHACPSYDATGIDFFTIDPPTSTDLDQAMHLERRAGGGYRVHYAIADVAAFVAPGGALDAEAHRRVTTLYFPDEKIPLHPAARSPRAPPACSPDQDRPALLWTIDLDADGAHHRHRRPSRPRPQPGQARLRRAYSGRSTRYRARIPRAAARHRHPARAAGGRPRRHLAQRPRAGDRRARPRATSLTYRAPLPADGWNAQISLLTGMAAAGLMLAYGTGHPAHPAQRPGRRGRPAAPFGAGAAHRVAAPCPVRRSSSAPSTRASRTTRPSSRSARLCCAAPGTPCSPAARRPSSPCTPRWPPRTPTARPRCAASSTATRASSASPPWPARTRPDWVLAALDELPKEMAQGTGRANTVERECVDIVEAALLKDRVGEVFDATVVDVKRAASRTVGTVHLKDPAVVGPHRGRRPPPAGRAPAGPAHPGRPRARRRSCSRRRERRGLCAGSRPPAHGATAARSAFASSPARPRGSVRPTPRAAFPGAIRG